MVMEVADGVFIVHRAEHPAQGSSCSNNDMGFGSARGSLNTIRHGVLLILVVLGGRAAADGCVVLRSASLSVGGVMEAGVGIERQLKLSAVRCSESRCGGRC